MQVFNYYNSNLRFEIYSTNLAMVAFNLSDVASKVAIAYFSAAIDSTYYF